MFFVSSVLIPNISVWLFDLYGALRECFQQPVRNESKIAFSAGSS